MAHSPTVTLPVKADPSAVISFCRIVSRHLTALADELEQHPARPGTASQREIILEHEGMGVCNKGRRHVPPCDYGGGA